LSKRFLIPIFIYRNGCATEISKKIKDGKNKKSEHIKEIMGVKGKPDIIDIRAGKTTMYGYVKRMPEERILKLIMD